ncbi:cysteine hydrolase family protein [Lentibacillus salicampi]|uniref:Cysteine hydrolase n=1 Tax=Lentibacillus salicampi TaxID=175306 RepID=A0A4Y9A9X7_9BACI|nr:isochorismatase family cysteine hydrolase [Lentibacillus salicampi]TFJ90656.1 cysteine hydrolase [Lentibacillus salicampi]
MTLDTAKTALVIIDMQKESQFGIQGQEQIVRQTREVITECRKNNIPIIYTRHINRNDRVGLSKQEPLNHNNEPVFYNSKTDAIDIIDDIQPESHDIVIDKYRWSGFYDTHLDLLLKSMGIKHIILGGVVTDGCVMTSVFDAYFRDYQVNLVKDICGATNEGAHMSAILTMANWIYNIAIFDADEMIKKLSGQTYHYWESTYSDQLQFTPENIRDVFGRLDQKPQTLQSDTEHN